jgi:predicted amidohydrolase
VGVNRVGEDGNKVPFSGDSMVVNPVGEPLTHLRYTEQVSTITLAPEKLTKTRRHMPFLQEQDGFQLIKNGSL